MAPVITNRPDIITAPVDWAYNTNLLTYILLNKTEIVKFSDTAILGGPHYKTTDTGRFSNNNNKEDF